MHYRLIRWIGFSSKNPWKLNSKWRTRVNTCKGLIVCIQNKVRTPWCARECDCQVPTVTLRVGKLTPCTTSFYLATRLASSEGVPHTNVTIPKVCILCPLTHSSIHISLNIPVSKILNGIFNKGIKFRDQPKRCRPKQKERIQKAESFCRKQKLTERPVFLQKEVSFCRKRSVSAERGRFLQKPTFLQKGRKPKAFCRNTVAFLQKESISAERQPFCRNTPFCRK